jgi:hypothetical protein
MRLSRIIHVALRICAAIGAVGCYNSATSIEIVDVAASELAIRPSIIDSDPAPSDGKVPVVVQFTRGNAFVQLAASNTVTCNGVALSWNGLGYAERVPIVPAGGSLAVVYARAGVSTQVSVAVPVRPAVTSPASGAVLPRTPSLAIGYPAASSAGIRPGASDGATGLSGAEQPDTGTATLDVSKLRAGPGTVDISRRIVTSSAGAGFASVQITYSISSPAIHVTWQ